MASQWFAVVVGGDQAFVPLTEAVALWPKAIMS